MFVINQNVLRTAVTAVKNSDICEERLPLEKNQWRFEKKGDLNTSGNRWEESVMFERNNDVWGGIVITEKKVFREAVTFEKKSWPLRTAVTAESLSDVCRRTMTFERNSDYWEKLKCLGKQWCFGGISVMFAEQ